MLVVSGNSGRPRSRLALLSEGDTRFLLPEGDARFLLPEGDTRFLLSEGDARFLSEATGLFNVSGKSDVLESGSAVVVEIRGTRVLIS